MKLPKFDGREIVPVRLIPFLTRRQRLSPDHLAMIFGWSHPFRTAKRRWMRSVYKLSEDGSVSELRPRDWDHVLLRLNALAAELDRADTSESERSIDWGTRSIAALPSGVFVGRDDLEAEYARMFRGEAFYVDDPSVPDLVDGHDEQAFLKRLIQGDLEQLAERGADWGQLSAGAEAKPPGFGLMTRPEDGDLSFDPILSAEQQTLVLEGFASRMSHRDVRRGDEAAADETGKGGRWTPERLLELEKYRALHNTMAAARHFGISDARVRQLLPRRKPRPLESNPFGLSKKR